MSDKMAGFRLTPEQQAELNESMRAAHESIRKMGEALRVKDIREGSTIRVHGPDGETTDVVVDRVEPTEDGGFRIIPRPASE